MQQRVYECSMNSVDKLKLRLDVWNSLHQNVIDAAINDCRKQLRACMHADGQHFEHLLREWVTDKSYGQIKYKYLKKTLLYLWTCDFRGFKVSQGKVRTINRWGGMSDHLWWHIYSAVFLEKNTAIGQLIVEIIDGGWVVSFFWDTVYFTLWFLLSFFSFIVYSQPSQIGSLVNFHTWFGLSANSEYRTQKIATNSPSAHHRTTSSGYTFAAKANIFWLTQFFKW